jgi:hypothetical protein
MIGGRYFNILEDDDVQDSMQWCGYCVATVAVFVVAIYVFVVSILMIKN